MNRNLSIRSLMLSCGFVLIFAGSGVAANDVAVKGRAIPSEYASQTSKKRRPLLTISAEALLHKLKQNQPVTLVDIRSPKEFNKVEIPGSINISLYAIKTKAFLKSTPFVLVEEGYRYKFLERQCKNLRDEGFEASFLIGGLNAWKQRGGPLQEDVFEHKTFNRISSQAFYQGKNHEEWMVINASTEQTPASMELFPNAFHIPDIGHAELVALAVKKMVGPRIFCEFCPLLIFTEDGKQYEKVESSIENSGIRNVFYLRGGLRAYEEFVYRLALSRKPRNERLKASRECGTCLNGKAQEAESQQK